MEQRKTCASCKEILPTIHDTKADAEAARLVVMEKFAKILHAAGIPAAVIAISSLHKETGKASVSLVVEGIGNPDLVKQIVDALALPVSTEEGA